MNFAVISTEIFILCLGLFAIVMDLVLPAKESHKSIGAVLIPLYVYPVSGAFESYGARSHGCYC